jgi:hypothetical protein
MREVPGRITADVNAGTSGGAVVMAELGVAGGAARQLWQV